MKLPWTIINFVSVIIIGLGIALLTYWQYQPAEVLTAKQPFTVSKVEDRTLVILNADYCKKIKRSGVVRISFVSKSAEFFSPMATESMSTGCHVDQKLIVLLPADIPADNYYIKFNATYKINPIKTFNKVLVSEEFEIKQ